MSEWNSEADVRRKEVQEHLDKVGRKKALTDKTTKLIVAWLRDGANLRYDAEMNGSRSSPPPPDWITMKDLADQIEMGIHLHGKHSIKTQAN